MKKVTVTPNHKSPGIIEGVRGPYKEDHGILTSNIFVKLDNGGTQGFGGIALDNKSAEDWIASLCYTFHVTNLEKLVGKKCYALYSFGRYGDSIDGLISMDTGKKFVLDTWRRKLWPAGTPKDRLSSAIESIKANISFQEQRILREKAEMKELPSKFVNWEKENG